jgi:hypothetical protein
MSNRASLTVKNVVAGLLAMLCSSCFCDRKVESEQYSPSRKIAKVTITRCGALNGEDTIVTVRRSAGIFAKDKVVVEVNDRVSIGIIWRDDTTLVVSLPRSALGSNFIDRKIAVQNSRVDDIEIEYHFL